MQYYNLEYRLGKFINESSDDRISNLEIQIGKTFNKTRIFIIFYGSEYML